MTDAPKGSPERLIHMSNQIWSFFRSYPHDKAVAGIAEHIGQFWDRRMRESILAHRAGGGEGLEPAVIEALDHMAKAQPKSGNHQIKTRD